MNTREATANFLATFHRGRLGDLNAIHAIESSLGAAQMPYAKNLWDITRRGRIHLCLDMVFFDFLHANQQQRAEALLITLKGTHDDKPNTIHP